MKAIVFGSVVVLSLMIGACSGGQPSPPRVDSTGTPTATPATREFELPSGTALAVRLDRSLSTVRNRSGDRFNAVLAAPVVVEGVEVLPTGTAFSGHLTTSRASGRLEGRAVLGLTLDAFELDGQHYPIRTSADLKATAAHKRRNVKLIGGGAGVGALIGAVAGGGKGAGIGAAVGAAGGTGVAATTGKKDVAVPAETMFRFFLTSPVRVQSESARSGL